MKGQDKQGRVYARFTGTKAGDRVLVYADFPCIAPWSTHTVRRDAHGLFIPCDKGQHYLDGQLTGSGHLVGIYKVEGSAP